MIELSPTHPRLAARSVDWPESVLCPPRKTRFDLARVLLLIGRPTTNLAGKVTRWLVSLSILVCGCGDALAATAWGGAENSFPASARQDGGARSQEHQDQTKDKSQASEPQITDPFEALGLALESYKLAERPSRGSAIEALKRYKALFAFYQSQDFKIGMAASLYACGGAYYFLGQMRESVDAFTRASDYSRESGFDFLRPFVDSGLGAAYASLGETGKALEMLDRALPTIRLMDNSPMLAQTLRGLGEANVYIGQKHKALEYLTEAVNIYRETKNWQFEVQVLPLISALKSSLGQPTEAMEYARAAVSRAKENGDSDWEAYGYFAVGAAYASVGKLEEAATSYGRSLQLLRGKNDRSGEATAFNNLGLIYVARGDFDRAMDYFQRALELSKSSDNPKMAGYASQNIGTIYYQRGEPVNALRHFEEALAIADQSNDRRLKAAVQANMADAYFLTNGLEYALKLFKESADTFREIEEPVHEMESLISLADGYGALGRYQEALDALRPVLGSERIAEDSAQHGYVIREMGYIYNLMGERDEAIKHFKEALSRLEAAGDIIGQVDLYGVWGAAYVSSGDYQMAEELFTRGVTLARKVGLRRSEMLILAELGALNERQGDLARAEYFYDQEIAAGESLRSSARIEELKTGVGNISATLLAPAVLLKFKLGKWREAFELVEKARARTFLDQMNGARVDIRKRSAPELMAREQSLRFDMQSLEEKLRKERRNNPASEAVRLMAASLKEKEEAYAAMLVRLKATNPEYAQLRSYSPVPLEKIQRLLGPQTTLVSYFVTADKMLAFVVGSDFFRAVEIPVKEDDLRAAIDWFRNFASLDDPQPRSLKQLHAWLIAPILPHIKTAQVIIVSHGPLHYVPFAALTDGREYFGDEHTIFHLPSASIMPSLRGRIGRGGQRVLSMAQSESPGLPSLRYVDEEARSVARLYHSQPLLTGRATKAEFLKRASAYNVLHIAAHAELNATSPLFSRILLPSGEHNGAVEIREIFGMNLNRTDLVALSACETHLGKQSKGDDIVSLNRAFMYAGASSVIASLWIVDDEATSLLMKAFYSHLKQGMSKAEALRAAQLTTRRRYPHPYYWAAFVLTGDPGKTTRLRAARIHALAGGAK